jgi:hypothetical protein
MKRGKKSFRCAVKRKKKERKKRWRDCRPAAG